MVLTEDKSRVDYSSHGSDSGGGGSLVAVVDVVSNIGSIG